MSPANFTDIWVLDFEFTAPPGNRPVPSVMVARNFVTHEIVRLGPPQLASAVSLPFLLPSTGLVVTFFGSADLGCFLALGWNLPPNLIDLYAEFRLLTSGLPLPLVGEATGKHRRRRHSLLAALAHFGLGGMAAIEKEQMRQLAMRGGPFTADEERQLLDYCATDVNSTSELLGRMLPHIDLPRALLRGRYIRSVARIEWNGVPIDTCVLGALKKHWEPIRAKLVERVDRSNGIYADGVFRERRWEQFVGRMRIRWPRLPSGRLALDDETFRDMAVLHPAVVQPYCELRATLSRLRLNDLSVGVDGRNRVLLSAFASKTGRNQPSTSRFIFGPAKWLRGLILPTLGMAVAYVDWEQQEFGIGAALSGDPHMKAAYRSGDPYLAFGQQAGAIPPGASRETHAAVREQFKIAALSVQYGAGAEGIAVRLGVPNLRGQELLDLHRQTYPRFWEWSEAAVNLAVLTGRLQSTFGWQVRLDAEFNPRSIRNFPCQANGAEMLRLACIFATEAGIRVCAPVHDALLIEAPISEIDAVVAATQAHMRRASELVLGGFALRTDVKIVSHPDRFMDGRGRDFWDTVMALLAEFGTYDPPQGSGPSLRTGA